MSLTAKTFNAAQKIIKAIHKGKPNLFTSVDINRHFEILRASADHLWQLTGTEYNSVFVNTSLYNTDGSILNMNVTWGAFTVFTRGMQFTLPAGQFINAVNTGTPYPAVRIYLVATPVLVTFSDDPVMSGVSSPSLPSALASSDHLIYKNERLVYSVYPNNPALNTGEEVVAKIATIIPFQLRGTLFDLPDTTLSSKDFIPKLYSLTNSAYSEKVKNLIGDNYGTDVSLAELNQYILDYFLGYGSDPIGVWKGYAGVLTGNFDGTGLGLNKFAGWALMNGNNGTFDWRGRSPIGYDDRSVNPGNGIWDAAYNQIGNIFGEKTHKLTIAEKPKQIIQVSLGAVGGITPDTGGGYGYGNDKPIAPVKVSIDTGGQDVPHNTVHPVAVSCYIMRIA